MTWDFLGSLAIPRKYPWAVVANSRFLEYYR